MIFGASADVSGLATSAEQRGLTRLMQRAWYAFSDDPHEGLERGLGWGRFDPDGETLVLLGLGGVAEMGLAYPGVYNGGCGGVTMGALGVGG